MKRYQFRWSHVKVGIPIAIVVVYLWVFVISGSGGPSVPHYTVAATSSTLGPPPSVVDFSTVPLPPVEGTTTTALPTLAGRAHLSGAVLGPQGAVPGAVVHVERLVGDAVAAIDLVAGPDGRWDLPGVAGGRFRIRAFLAPTLAQIEPEVLFLPDGEERSVDLQLLSFTGVTAAVAVAPDPPVLREPLTLAVQMTFRTVDATGIVRATPLVGRFVDLTQPGAWQLRSATPARTDSSGQATFGLECRTAGPNRIQVLLEASSTGTGTEPSQTFDLTVPDCFDPASTSTTTVPVSSSSSSTPGSSSTTSSSETTTTTG